MKGHRNRGKAAAVVVPRHGRAVRLSGGEKRRMKHLGRTAAWDVEGRNRLLEGLERCDGRVREYGDGSAPAIVLTAKEKQALRHQRAVAKHTPLKLLGKATRALQDKFAALRGAQS